MDLKWLLTPNHQIHILLKLKSIHKFSSIENNLLFHTLFKSFKLKFEIQILIFKYFFFQNEP